jgi:putative nucleotidyltransferase with HDIG domain
VGGQYVDIADFSSAMRYLDVAVQLARKIGDPTIEAACLANVVAVLQEMGHYRQAISMARRVLALKDESPNARTLKVQCASNGLFASHRIDDSESAAHFLDMGQRFISRSTDPLRLSFFERSRVLYLVDLGQTGRARECLAATLAVVDVTASPRFNTLLTIADSICKWAEGDKSAARESLRSLYVSSKSSRLYHHFVLQGLIKVYADASIPGDVSLGINYAKELVEYTTGVKKAKFYRQLATRREEAEQKVLSAASSTSIDPFGQAREWLSLSEITVPLDDAGERRQLVKHEELTAIHEDMAKLRAMSIRREIRTDAVDTAENWAIAAEFFDDETGQHCYRVGHLATMLAREIGMDETFCVQVEHAARLHDIGKIAVNEVILLKPGPLDASEMAAMRLHTEVGAQILAGSDDPTLKMAVEVARHHHEWWNGAGYPVKLSGRDIPISARICAYADVYDALTHMRSYKKAWTHERAVEEITRLGGIQFDPDLLGPFTAVLERYRSDLAARAIPGFADMDSNSLIASRRKLMETIGAGT